MFACNKLKNLAHRSFVIISTCSAAHTNKMLKGAIHKRRMFFSWFHLFPCICLVLLLQLKTNERIDTTKKNVSLDIRADLEVFFLDSAAKTKKKSEKNNQKFQFQSLITCVNTHKNCNRFYVNSDIIRLHHKEFFFVW